MKNAIVGTSIALAFVIGASADPWNKKTILDVKETILIPGKELPPGKYVMKLADSQSNRHIVQVFNEDETKVEATILAIPNSRLQPTGDTALGYWETPAGVPPALRSWFYPGDNFGQEFAYPKAVADRLAAANKTKVPWYEASETATISESTLRTTEVHDAGEPPPAPSKLPETSTSAPLEREQTTAQRETVTEQPAQEPVQTAQNRPEPPAETPQPAEEQAATPETLPQTATPYGVLLLGGLGLLAAGRVLFAPKAN